jgi:hypothetical protein
MVIVNILINLLLIVSVFIEAGIFTALAIFWLSIAIWCHHYRIG